MFALVVRFDLKDMTAVDAFDALVAELLPEISVKEPGTLVYTVHSVTGAPLSRVFYECYANEEAFHTHGTYPHTRRFLAERKTLLAARRVELLKPTGGTGC